MTSLLEIECTPLVAAGESKVVGVAAGGAEGGSARLVVTYAERGAEAFDLRDRACVRSWAQTPGGSLSCPAALHAPTRCLVSASGPRVLSWDAAASALNGVRSSPPSASSAPVFRVVSGVSDSAVAVVLADSSVCRCTVPKPGALRRCGPQPSPGCRAVSALFLADSSLVLVAFEDATAGPRLRVVSTAEGDGDGGGWHHCGVVALPGSPSGRLAACALDCHRRVLCAFWSSGTWATFSLGAVSSDPMIAPAVLTSGQFQFLDLSRPVAADYVGRDVLVVAGVLAGSWEGRAGVPPKGSLVAMAVETAYGTAHSVQRLPSAGDAEAVAQVLSLGVVCEGRAAVAVATASGVTTCDVHLRPVTLGTAIASGLPTSQPKQGADPGPPLVTLAQLLPPDAWEPEFGVVDQEEGDDGEDEDEGPEMQLRSESLTAATESWSKAITEQNEAEQAVIARILDPDSTPAQVLSEVERFLQSKRPPVARKSKKKKKKKKQQQLQKKKDGKQAAETPQDVSFGFIRAVARRVCSQQDVRSIWVPMRKLLLLRIVTHSAAPELIATCAAQNFLKGLEDCLLLMRDIPDADIVRLVSYVITTAKDDVLRAFSSSHKRLRSENPSVGRRYLLTLVINLPRNEVFAHKFLKNLSAPEVTFLLQFLSTWLGNLHINSESQMMHRKTLGKVVPAQRQVTGWIETLLDAQVSSILLMPECQQVLASIATCLREEIRLCEHAQAIKPYLSQLVRHSTLPRDQVSDYQIEVMRF